MKKVNLPFVPAQGTKSVSAPDSVENSRFSLFSALPPLSVPLADRFQHTKNKKIAYSVPLFHLNVKNGVGKHNRRFKWHQRARPHPRRFRRRDLLEKHGQGG